ncbi:MAG: hypothetical protein MK085_01875 [Phycisphaerales bacterium]|nr:hypothetical protein [Phycisphaerales bacterium]
MSSKEKNPRDTERREVIDRRSGLDRRDLCTDESDSGLDRRRGPGRRLTDFVRAAEEGDMSREQFMFLSAIEQFKRANGVSFPTWTDVLEVVRRLGYRKTMASELRLGSNVEDWVEPHDAANCVDHGDQESPERYRKAG